MALPRPPSRSGRPDSALPTGRRHAAAGPGHSNSCTIRCSSYAASGIVRTVSGHRPARSARDGSRTSRARGSDSGCRRAGHRVHPPKATNIPFRISATHPCPDPLCHHTGRARTGRAVSWTPERRVRMAGADLHSVASAMSYAPAQPEPDRSASAGRAHATSRTAGSNAATSNAAGSAHTAAARQRGRRFGAVAGRPDDLRTDCGRRRHRPVRMSHAPVVPGWLSDVLGVFTAKRSEETVGPGAGRYRGVVT